MRNSILAVAVACLVPSFARADTVSLLTDVGILKSGDGKSLEPVGGLLQLLASPTGVFSPPTSAGYATGDNILLRSFAMNYYSGIPGESVNALYSIPFVTPAYTVTAGEKILLRYYTTLTYAAMPAAPTAGAAYGQVRSDTIEFGPAGGDYSETPWVLPSGGSTVDMDYVTRGDGGTYFDQTAYATGVVAQRVAILNLPNSGVAISSLPAGVITIVPEPASAAALAAAAGSLAGRRRRSDRRP